MNTFVDDVAAFLVDMPLLHRLSCLRDDVIFVCYVYQRWAYRVDKNRPNRWTQAADAEGSVENRPTGMSEAAGSEASTERTERTASTGYGGELSGRCSTTSEEEIPGNRRGRADADTADMQNSNDGSDGASDKSREPGALRKRIPAAQDASTE